MSRPGSPDHQSARSLSPERRVVKVNEEDPVYMSAMNKLRIAVSKFNRETSAGAIWLKSIENRELDPDLFRQSIRAAMNCKISHEEFNALMPHFDNNGFVNGCDFLLLFYQIRFQHRSDLLTARIAKEKAFREKDKKFVEARRKEIEGKTFVKISYQFTEAQSASMMEKVRDAAWRFDRSAPGSANLEAFECMYMMPETFKEQLRRTFNLVFSPAEFGAFLSMPEISREPDHKVYCTDFLLYFLKLGVKERTFKMKRNLLMSKELEEERLTFNARRLEELEQKNVEPLAKFSMGDKERALSKMRKAAFYYDKAMPGSMSMQNFEMKEMAPHVFKEQCKRVFNLNLTSQELSAIISIFDERSAGNIPCQEFAKTFLAMGLAERAQRQRINLELQREADIQRAKDAEMKLKAQEDKAKLKADQEFSDKDRQTAMFKMTEAAWKFEKSAPGAPNLDAFDMKSMEPHVFKEQLRRAFNMKLYPAELAALMDFFDPDKTGLIDCQGFLRRFLRIGFEERDKKEKRWREMQMNTDKQAKIEAEEKLRASERKVHLKVAAHSQKDLDSAMQKVHIASINYRKSPSDTLDAFEAQFLPPHVFKEQLKLVFNIRVSMEELAALMAYYDPQNTGVIHCKDFMNKFLRLGYEEREKIEAGWREERKAKKENDAAISEEHERKKILKQLDEVDFNFTEEHFDKAIHKFVRMCHAFQVRQLGPAGWAGFSAASFRPAEFREMLKRTFNVTINAAELGALVTYFLTKPIKEDEQKVVNTQYFLNCFVQARVQCEGYKGKSDEFKSLREYEKKLKMEYRERKEKMGGGIDNTRPWRTIVAMRKSTSGKVVLASKAPYPATPQEKIMRRLVAGKKTGKMDLAAKASWKEGEDPMAGAVQVDNDKPNRKKSPMSGVRRKIETTKKESAEDKALAMLESSSQQDIRTKAEYRLLSVPAEVFKLDHLIELWLCNNRLGAIPEELGKLKKLQVLSLQNNDLPMVPPEVCALPVLTRLILADNNIVGIPKEMAQMKQLREIDLKKNQIYDFPEALMGLPNLLSLNLQDNDIQTLPSDTVSQVTNLKTGDTKNYFKFAQQLRTLQYLNLEGNPISNSKLPPECLSQMYWLEVVGVHVPSTIASAERFKISKQEEEELKGLLTTKAKGSIQRAKK